MQAAARRLDADGASLTVCSVTITSNRTALVPEAMGPMMGVVYAGDAREPIGGDAVFKPSVVHDDPPIAQPPWAANRKEG